MAGLARRDSFAFRVDLDADAVWERVRTHPSVRVTDHPAPDPAPPNGPPFLASRTADNEVCVRRWASPADAASPIVVLQMHDEGPQCVITGHFAPARAEAMIKRTKTPWWHFGLPGALLASVFVVAGIVLGGSTALLVPLLLVLFAIPAGAVMLPMMLLWNAQDRKRHRDSLQGFVGEMFVPIALPEAGESTPFR